MEFDKYDVVKDARGKKCPMPAAIAKVSVDDSNPGTIILIISDDEGSAENIPKQARSWGARVLGVLDEGGVYKILLEKE